MRIVVALGGNALLRRGEPLDAAVQLDHIREAARALAPLARDHELLICHGNGPQVGLLATESENDRTLTSPYPLDALDAQTQGMIGYWIQRELANAGSGCRAVSLVTQTLVRDDDPAFGRPTKFIGPGYHPDQAALLSRQRGWAVAQDGQAWRRVVASPEPQEILELDAARILLSEGFAVVCGGGGGAAVTRRDGVLTGVEAVVDKDLVAALIAERIGAQLLVILTDVAGILADYGKPGEHVISGTTPTQIDRLTLPAGSMAPKAQAAARFVRRTGQGAAIGSLNDVAGIVVGTSGTHVHPDGTGAYPSAPGGRSPALQPVRTRAH